jgi:hypothetical protein
MLLLLLWFCGALQVTVVIPGRGKLQLTVPVDVTGSDLLQLLQQQAEVVAAST